MSVILATQEVEKGGSQFWNQSRQSMRPYPKSNLKELVPVAHTCNPSYSGGRDQEEQGMKPAPGKQFKRPYLKSTQYKKGIGTGQLA
jgi:hypothetical protein